MQFPSDGQNFLSYSNRSSADRQYIQQDYYKYQQPGFYTTDGGTRITGGVITGGVATKKSDKLDEDFFKVELPKLNQEN